MSGIEKDVTKYSVFANFSRLIVSLKPVGAKRLILLVKFVPAIYLFITQKRGAPKNSSLSLKVALTDI
jgi:hypothetical protein